MIDVVVVAGIPLYREGLALALGHGGRVQVVGTAAKVVSRRPSYYVHILAEVAASDDMAVLAAAHGRLEPGVLSYRTAVEFTAPEVGHYQLLGTVVISDYNALGVTVGPKLKVIP